MEQMLKTLPISVKELREAIKPYLDLTQYASIEEGIEQFIQENICGTVYIGGREETFYLHRNSHEFKEIFLEIYQLVSPEFLFDTPSFLELTH